MYLIVSFNDPNHKPLRVGDKVFALFQNADKTFTTVYYNAKIRKLKTNNRRNQIVIDFLDGTGQYTNIAMATHANILSRLSFADCVHCSPKSTKMRWIFMAKVKGKSYQPWLWISPMKIQIQTKQGRLDFFQRKIRFVFTSMFGSNCVDFV